MNLNRIRCYVFGNEFGDYVYQFHSVEVRSIGGNVRFYADHIYNGPQGLVTRRVESPPVGSARTGFSDLHPLDLKDEKVFKKFKLFLSFQEIRTKRIGFFFNERTGLFDVIFNPSHRMIKSEDLEQYSCSFHELPTKLRDIELLYSVHNS